MIVQTGLSRTWSADGSGDNGSGGGDGGSGGEAYGGYGGSAGGSPQTGPEESGGSFNPAAVSGNLSAADPDGDSLTYSATQPNSGSLALNSSTGAFTYTPASGDSNTVIINFTASDGIKTSNIASLVIDGYQVLNDPTTGDSYIQYDQLPYAGPNQGYIGGGAYSMVQGGTLQVNAPGVLANASPASQDSGTPTVGSIIEQPQHGSLSLNDSDGSFTYTPDASFSGLDWFTWQVADNSGSGGYASAFIYVAPVNPTISVGSLTEGDPTAQIPNAQFPPDSQGDPQYATIKLNPGATLPTGSTVTLSINSDVQNDLDIYDGIPGQSGTNLLLGNDAGTGTYTWTISDTQAVPSQVYAVGLAGTEYDQITFTLSVSVGTTVYGDSGDNSPDASPPPAQPASQPATTQATVAGKHDYLIALDGTLDNSGSGTVVFQMTQDFAAGFSGYVPGVANSDTDGRGLNFAFGLTDMQHFVRKAETKLDAFYTEADHRAVALDVIGYSRGAIEAVQVMNDLANNGLILGPELTRDGRAIAAPAENLKPPIRFAGLISPVIGPADGTWPTSVPSTVGSIWVASAAAQVAWVRVHEQTITQNPQHPNGVVPIPFDYSHMDIGHKRPVLTRLEEAARNVKVIFGK